MKEIYTGYKDMDGREYKVGDIVLNTFFGDYWVVAKNRKNEREDCEYRLLLYNNEKEYYMDLDEPSKFRIVASKGESEYNNLLRQINIIRRKRNPIINDKFKKIFKALLKTILYFLCISIMLLLTMWFPFIMGTILILLIAVVVFIHFYNQD